jgi:hypothetical protein
MFRHFFSLVFFARSLTATSVKTIYDGGSDHNWKNDFFIKCLSPILEAMTNAKQQVEYEHILALDGSARDFPVPPRLGELENNTATPRFLVMQRGLVIMGREIGTPLRFLSLILT